MGRPGLNTQPSLVRAAAAARTVSSGSLHAGEPMPSLDNMEASRRAMMIRRQTSARYHTFPTPPPKTPRERSNPLDDEDESGSDDASDTDPSQQTPLPLRQLGLLAFLSLAEQTALNSISPYLPQMVESFPNVSPSQIGLYVGVLASAFALAQLSTNLLWGYLSDIVGRKPTMVLGTFMLMCCFVAFGFCKTYWQIIVVHVAMGMLNGNAAVVPTVLGEVTDRSNQSRAFTWLPVIYSLGSITGPALGGLLVGKMTEEFPYMAPNLISAALLLLSTVAVGIWFEETLESLEGIEQERFSEWVARLWSRIWKPSKPKPRNSWSSRWPRAGSRPPSPSVDEDDEDDEEEDDRARESSRLLNHDRDRTSGRRVMDGHADADGAEDDKDSQGSTWRDILTRNTTLVLVTYLIFQLANISFNGLYPIFAAAKPPTGRALSPGMIGVTLSVAGLATIVFQAFLFQHFKTHLGNLGTYRIALIGLAASMALMPFVGYRDGDAPLGIGSAQAWLYSELAVVLIIKNICAVGGLSSVMLLVRIPCTPAPLGPPFLMFTTMHANKPCLGRSQTALPTTPRSAP